MSEARDANSSVEAMDSAASAALRAAAKELVFRDCRFDGPNIIIPCADHAEALRLMVSLRAAICLVEGLS